MYIMYLNAVRPIIVSNHRELPSDMSWVKICFLSPFDISSSKGALCLRSVLRMYLDPIFLFTSVCLSFVRRKERGFPSVQSANSISSSKRLLLTRHFASCATKYDKISHEPALCAGSQSFERSFVAVR